MLRLGICTILAFAAIVAPASASYISKGEARTYAAEEVRDLWLGIDDAEDFWVESARRCERVADSVVECGFELYFFDGTVCEDTVQIVARRTTYRTRWPYEPDCY